MKLIIIVATKQVGTPLNNKLLNISVLLSSVVQEPRTKLPPDEKGETDVACAPIIIATNNNIGFIPVDAAIVGTIGNNAGHTTPIVLLKKDIHPPIRTSTIGIKIGGILDPTQLDNISIVPACIATCINIPTPHIIINVLQGTLAITAFSSPSFNNNAIAENIIAIKPTSILEFINAIVALFGNIVFNIGAINTIAIITNIKYKFVF